SEMSWDNGLAGTPPIVGALFLLTQRQVLEKPLNSFFPKSPPSTTKGSLLGNPPRCKASITLQRVHNATAPCLFPRSSSLTPTPISPEISAPSSAGRHPRARQRLTVRLHAPCSTLPR